MSEWLSAFAASTSALRAPADKQPLRRDISPQLALTSERERRRMKGARLEIDSARACSRTPTRINTPTTETSLNNTSEREELKFETTAGLPPTGYTAKVARPLLAGSRWRPGERAEHAMSLSAFIRDHYEEIISEFAVFARTLMPPGADMSEAQLRDHAEEILTAVVQDMGIAQTTDEQSRKSQGRGSANTMEASGRLHADDRIRHGFTFRSVIAEFRALRATVLRLYAASGATDLSEAARFNEAIDESLTASMDRFAVQTDQFRDQFIGVLSHDLRNPLGAITAGAALLALPEDNPQRRSWVVTRIMNSAQRMERMVGDLLDVTRARLGGSIALTRRPVDLQQVCDEALMELRVSQPDAVVRLESAGDLRGEWDPDRLAQVVSNLVGNAIQHGGGTPVTLFAHGDGDSVTLAVHNGGPPIPPDVLPFVFEPLARGRGDSAGHSIGLGLFIARAIVSAHGGNIQVSSSVDAGTTFTVALPKA